MVLGLNSTLLKLLWENRLLKLFSLRPETPFWTPEHNLVDKVNKKRSGPVKEVRPSNNRLSLDKWVSSFLSRTLSKTIIQIEV